MRREKPRFLLVLWPSGRLGPYWLAREAEAQRLGALVICREWPWEYFSEPYWGSRPRLRIEETT